EGRAVRVRPHRCAEPAPRLAGGTGTGGARHEPGDSQSGDRDGNSGQRWHASLSRYESATGVSVNQGVVRTVSRREAVERAAALPSPYCRVTAATLACPTAARKSASVMP